jgi:hypothetical protein
LGDRQRATRERGMIMGPWRSCGDILLSIWYLVFSTTTTTPRLYCPTSAAHAIVGGCPASPRGLSILLRVGNAYIIKKALKISFIFYTAATFIAVYIAIVTMILYLYIIGVYYFTVITLIF